MIYLITKNFVHLPQIKPRPPQVSEIGLFVKIVNRSITLLFLQEVTLGVWIYFVSVCRCYLIDIWLSVMKWSLTRREICLSQKSILCRHIVSFGLFNVNFWRCILCLTGFIWFNYTGLGFRTSLFKRDSENRRLLLTLRCSLTTREDLWRFRTCVFPLQLCLASV